jgi:hypothetical protein
MMEPQADSREATAYRLVVPSEWAALCLDPAGRQQSVTALVERQFAGLDRVPHLKAQARRELLARTEATHSAGGIELFLSMQRVADVPIAASLATFLIPPEASGSISADGLARCLAGDDRDVTLVDLPAGLSVRVRRYSGSPSSPGSAIQEVFVPVPGSGWWLLLVFAAPFGPLGQSLAKLFDAICATLRWD